MPAVSKKQQRLFGMVDAYQKGKMKNPPAKIKEVTKHISHEDVRHFAKTKREDLPEKVKKAFIVGFAARAYEAGLSTGEIQKLACEIQLEKKAFLPMLLPLLGDLAGGFAANAALEGAGTWFARQRALRMIGKGLAQAPKDKAGLDALAKARAKNPGMNFRNYDSTPKLTVDQFHESMNTGKLPEGFDTPSTPATPSTSLSENHMGPSNPYANLSEHSGLYDKLPDSIKNIGHGISDFQIRHPGFSQQANFTLGMMGTHPISQGISDTILGQPKPQYPQEQAGQLNDSQLNY